MLTYPCLVKRGKDGRYLATFPDIPEALTDGASHAEAITEAHDALLTALGGYISERRPIPPPSPLTRGRARVRLSLLAFSKLMLYEVMRAEQISNVKLGEQAGVHEGQVRRWLDLGHRSHIDQIERALEILGQPLSDKIQEVLTKVA